MSSPAVDVAVVGGGLAGCAAAISLARGGARVAMFEAKAFPHDKVCGEFLSPESADAFAALGVLGEVTALNPTPLHAALLTTPGGTGWTAYFERPGMGISRRSLDALLARAAQAAGAKVYDRATVTGISGSLESGFEITARLGSAEHHWLARAVVGAQGKRSLIDRALERSFLRSRQPFVGLKAYFDGPSLGGQVHLHAFPGGYCGLGRVETGQVNVCLLVRQERFAVHGSTDAFIDWMGGQNPQLGAWLAQARRVSERWLSISQVPFVAKPAVERDVLMAGDAAGLIAPLAGNGMSMALDAGLLAARFTGDFLDGRLAPAALRRGYADAWNRQFAGRLRLGRALQAVLLRPRLLEPGLRLLRHVPPLGELFVARTRDFRPA